MSGFWAARGKGCMKKFVYFAEQDDSLVKAKDFGNRKSLLVRVQPP